MTKTSFAFFTSIAATSLALSACQPAVEEAPPTAPDETSAAVPLVASIAPPIPDSVDQYGTPGEDRASGMAHVHGKAELAVMIEGKRLSVTFDSPLTNLIGFEHEPKTEADWALIDALQDQFLYDDALVRLPTKAKCDIISISSGLRLKDEHGSLMVEQDFACKKISRLQSAEVTVFTRYDNLEHLDVFVREDNSQTVTILTADRADLALEF